MGTCVLRLHQHHPFFFLLLFWGGNVSAKQVINVGRKLVRKMSHVLWHLLVLDDILEKVARMLILIYSLCTVNNYYYYTICVSCYRLYNKHRAVLCIVLNKHIFATENKLASCKGRCVCVCSVKGNIPNSTFLTCSVNVLFCMCA